MQHCRAFLTWQGAPEDHTNIRLSCRHPLSWHLDYPWQMVQNARNGTIPGLPHSCNGMLCSTEMQLQLMLSIPFLRPAIGRSIPPNDTAHPQHIYPCCKSNFAGDMAHKQTIFSTYLSTVKCGLSVEKRPKIKQPQSFLEPATNIEITTICVLQWDGMKQCQD